MTYLCYNYARKSNTMKQIHRTGSVIMYKIDFNQPCHIHFIGIGGISMSGLAEILLEEGFTVSGSDNKESALTDHLSQNGATVFYGQKASNIIDGIDLVVYTAAIHEDNEEFAEAKRQNLPMLSRAELLGQLMTNYKTPVAISGTHGKTTTTSMLSHIALAADLDPTISVGGILKVIEGNIRVGGPDLFITEACEYTNSFLHFFPKIGIILNVVNWPLGRVLMSYFASVYVRIVTGMKIQDTTAGFKCYRREVLETIDLDRVHFKGYAFQVEMKFTAYKCGFKLVEVPIIFINRALGVSKMNSSIFGEALFGVLQLKWWSFFRKYPRKHASHA